jgi:RNA polymerase sigma-70 factor, ECF subfamily
MPDEHSFASLVPPLTPVVLRVAAALVGMADAEDAAQEAILRAWQAWPTLRDAQSLRPWLLQITVNVCRSWLRSRFGRHQRMTEPLPDEEPGLPGVLLETSLGTPGHMAELDLHQALAELPDELRLIVTLRYFGGMDSTEIGRALDMPASSVRTRLRRALGLLRQELFTPDEQPSISPNEGGFHVR